MKRKLYIFGTQTFAELSHFYFHGDSDYEVAGFTVDAEYMKESIFLGLPVIPYEELRVRVAPAEADIFIAIGISKINQLRAKKFFQVQQDGYRLASFLSTRAHVSQDLLVQPNTMIMDHVAMHPQVQIGFDTIIWSNTRVALKAVIGNHVWVTAAVIGEKATIGDYTFIGINATIAPLVHVGSRNLIGAAAAILRDTQDNQIYRGPRCKPSPVSTLKALDLIR